jgi:hypothetical protein
MLILLLTLLALPVVSYWIHSKGHSKFLHFVAALLCIHGLFFLANASNSINYVSNKIDVFSFESFFFSVYYFVFLAHSLSKVRGILYGAIVIVSIAIIASYVYLLNPTITLGLSDVEQQTLIDDKFIIREEAYNYGWMDGGTRFVMTKIQHNKLFEQFYGNVDCVDRYPINYTIKIDTLNNFFIIKSQEKFDTNKVVRTDTFIIR